MHKLAIAFACPLVLAIASLRLFAGGALILDPANPHYFLFRGTPTVLVGSTEHYGAVVNLDFNYVPYLDELARDRLNLTRTWVGSYLEVRKDYDPQNGAYAIDKNTLAPEPGRFVCPWQRTSVPGAADGRNKFDLSKWNPGYFSRLRDFLRQAGKRGIVVELDLFCSYYTDELWSVSPLNARNNVNGIGDVSRSQVYTLKHPDLLRAQDAMVRKIVREVRRFDNVYFEICNEPYYGSVRPEWQQHISNVIVGTEANGPSRHLIAQNVAQGSVKLEHPDPNVSIYNFHYSRPPDSVALNYHLNRVIGVNETGFDGQADATYRIQGWDFLMAGGALYNNLDFSFAAGHERGDFPYKSYTPGGGSAALRSQLGILTHFMDELPLVDMRPESSVIQGSVAEGTSVRVLAEPGKVYAIYIHNGHVVEDAKPQYVVDDRRRQLGLVLELPGASYDAEWIDTRTGEVIKRDHFAHAGGGVTVDSPPYSEDVALRIRSAK